MPGSSFSSSTTTEPVSNSNMSGRQPPQVAPRNINVSVQAWQSSTTTAGDNGYASRHARSASMDSLESSESSSSSGGSNGIHRCSVDSTADYIPTRTVGKTPKLPSHNPLQFVKVQSPLYKKAEQQIQLTKEVKVTRETLKEGEEEWQSVCMPTSTDWTLNLDNWKSRRRKVSEKVIQRAEEMRQIEAEEQLRQEQYQQQQRKIKKFSEIVEKRSSRSYNLDLYIGQGDDSGLGGTPEPDDVVDNHSSILRSDTSEGMTSEAESIDSDIHKSDKIIEREPPKVPQKPQTRLQRDESVDEYDSIQASTMNFSQSAMKDLSAFDNFSSTEPSDIEGHCGDNETISSEEDIPYLPDDHNPSHFTKTVCDENEDNCIINKFDDLQLVGKQEIIDKTSSDIQINDAEVHSFNICIKSGDNRGFGFTLKGGKDQRCPPYIDSIVKYSAADVTGLKVGDQIISLNGEKAVDSSHASLIFSVKQAVYTGVLDIVIRRSEKTTIVETQVKHSGRKSSFAEKLALFSSGVNATTTSTDEQKSSITSYKTDDKPESLVLRRRSAFENGKSENPISHRRSSCMAQGSNIVKAEGKRLSADISLSQFNTQESFSANNGTPQRDEKRRSADLSISQFNTHEGLSSKKGPPPPVPVKPKIKHKTPQVSPNTDLEVNNLNKNLENFHYSTNSVPDLSLFNVNEKSISLSEPSLKDNETTAQLKQQTTAEVNKDQHVENIHNNADNTLVDEVEYSESICHSICDNEMSPNSKTVQNFNFSEVLKNDSSNMYQPIGKTDSIIVNLIENPSSKCTYPENDLPTSTSSISPLTTDHSSESQIIEDLCESVPNMIIPEEPVSESFITVSFSSTKPSNYDDGIQVLSESMHACFELQTDNDGINGDVDLNQLDIYAQNCTIYESETSDENVMLEDPHANDFEPQNENEDTSNVGNLDDFEENKNINVGSSDDSINTISINSSPLCLPLEKIDEDDVISASTTTSSETPDTETVIETLPSNLSPLPNDESNGEESCKLSKFQDSAVEHCTDNTVIESSSVSFNIDGLKNSTECSQTFSNVPNREVYSSNLSDSVNNPCSYTEEQDDEYCRELDESLDQITSLDVIDEIEQRLMHQLEQQGDTFGEIDEGLTAQLEDDINKQWLYFTEESELLDDLTPRSNIKPPSEPPPPPPSEQDNSVEKLMPMTRANSTKRIKKELWRRRSDFLGLDSPEGIDVDKILLPPPGLEEILKKEREQNQWLEKRFSLAENTMSAPLYINETDTLKSQEYNDGEYSKYFLEEYISDSPVDCQSEYQIENLDNDCTYESSCDLQYVPEADVPSPASEETPKIAEESPQRKAKQNIHNLGAAPKAKIMDSNKWITEKGVAVSKKTIEPVFHQNSYNQNYWLAKDDERKKVQNVENAAERRFSVPQFSNQHPDVTIRTWGDREYEFQKQRPRSAAWSSSSVSEDMYSPYSHPHRKDVLHSHSLDKESHKENCDTYTLESEVHSCSCCGKGLCEGSAMGIEALRLYFHIECFRCCICHMQLGNGSCGTDVQVKNNRLFCPNCFTVD